MKYSWAYSMPSLTETKHAWKSYKGQKHMTFVLGPYVSDSIIDWCNIYEKVVGL